MRPRVLLVTVLLLPATVAQAQRLLTLTPGVEQAASVSEAGASTGPSIGPAPTAVQVDLALLRSAPHRLEVPTPDGSVLSARRSVFEDRGGGDLMWSGGQPGAGYDTVVLTVEGGRFVGRFAAAGGGAYQIHAERDGTGGMAPIGGPRLDDWCGVDSAEEGAHDGHAHGAASAYAGALAADPPRRVSNPRSHDRLDILVAYTATAARNWAGRGGPEAAIRHAGDYMKMVFRNNRIEVEPHIVHIAQVPAALDWGLGDRAWWRDVPLHLTLTSRDGELLRLRHEHRADFVHLVMGEGPLVPGYCGTHSALLRSDTAESFFQAAYGWTSNHGFCGDYAATFVHEVGHGLGAHHEPAWTRHAPELRFRPYATGYVNDDVVPSIGTAMTYGGQTEPFFSTSRFDLFGATVGVRGEQDNERTLQETVHIGVRYSDYLPLLEDLPAQPTGLRARFEGGAAHLAWRDNAPGADGYELEYEVSCLDLGKSRFYTGRTELCFGEVLAVQGRTGAIVPLEHPEPGTRYYFRLRTVKGEARSLPSSYVLLVVPGEPLEAPSDVLVTVDPTGGSVDVRWTDNSDDEAGFDVQLLQNGEFSQRIIRKPDSEHARFIAWNPEAEVTQGDSVYAVRVLAFDSAGYAVSSEEVSFRWEHPEGPPTVSDVTVSAIGPTTARVTWTVDQRADRYHLRATAPGERYDVSWSRPDDHAVETAWVDFEGLAPGGRYRFDVRSARQDLSRPVFRYLTLGERGRGPRAPSEISMSEISKSGDRRWFILSWEDNSADEQGFIVQASFAFVEGRKSWRRQVVGWWDGQPFLRLPADTKSVRIWSYPEYIYRVFAYNERGYSLSSPRLDGRPKLDLAATAGDAMVGLNWGVEFRGSEGDERLTGTQVRWKATSGLPFSAGDTWVDLPQWPRAYTVTGLRNGTEYTFAVRAVTSEGLGLTWTAAATPRRGLPPLGRQAAGSCRSDGQTLCLRDSRFRARAFRWGAGVRAGLANVVNEGTDESGIFEFFDPENWEILLKVLDGCATNGKVWVFGASTTDLGYRIEVIDTVTGETRTYENEPGRPAPAIVDTQAFSRACDAGPAVR